MGIWKYYSPVFEYQEMFADWYWPWSGHKFFAYDLVRNIKPKRLVELGTHRGTSFFSMCQAVKDGKLPTNLTAVDTWIGDKHAGEYGEEVFVDINKIKIKFYDELAIHFLRKTFDQAWSDFKPGSIDLLHIDGLHTYSAAAHDYYHWFNRVNPNGIIILHDTYETKKDFGVYKLWAEIVQKIPATFNFWQSHGLGIICLGKSQILLQTPEVKKWQAYYDNKNEQLLKDLIAELDMKYQELARFKQEITASKFYKIYRLSQKLIKRQPQSEV